MQNQDGADDRVRTYTPLRELEPKGNRHAAYCRKQTEISGIFQYAAAYKTAFRQQIDHRNDHNFGGSQ